MVMVIAIAMAMVMVMVMILSFGWSILVIYLDSCLCFPELVQSSPVAGCPHHRQPSALVAQDPRQFQRRWLQHDVILPAFNKLPSALFPVSCWLWILHWWRRTSDCNWLEQTAWCQHNRKLQVLPRKVVVFGRISCVNSDADTVLAWVLQLHNTANDRIAEPGCCNPPNHHITRIR